MFGYLRVDKGELKVREYEAYKSVYCGLCRQLGREYTFPARLILSYDCTFYAMLLMSLGGSCTGFRDGRCVFNPLKKCKFASCKNDSYSKAAALSVITFYYKLKDNLADSGFFKKIPVYLALPFVSFWRKRAVKKFPLIENTVADMMKAQLEVEQNTDASCDDAAHPTAEMLAKILSFEAKSKNEELVLRELGYQLGRWVYLIDAADDLEKDIKSGCFNPFGKYKTENRMSEVDGLLSISLGRAYDAYCLLDVKDFKGIANNILQFGLPLVQSAVTAKLTEENNDKSL